MIFAYGFSSVDSPGPATNSGSLIGFFRFTANTGTRWKPSFVYSRMAGSLSCRTDRSRWSRPRPMYRSASIRTSASPTPGVVHCGSTARHHRLAPFSGSSNARTWSTPVTVPTTAPVRSSCATR